MYSWLNQVQKVQKDSILVLEAITTKVLEKDSDIYILYFYLFADSESYYEEEALRDSDKELDDHWWWVINMLYFIVAFLNSSNE